ncbi:hypothetical protein [Paenibacillus cellulositrophicus]|uniref:hypothetical protein n=1 Tax=Paenibacillus cellulositrophicus TaxID=562959 RepID=UPI003D983EBA
MAGTKPGKYNDGKQQIKQFKEGSRHEDRLSFFAAVNSREPLINRPFVKGTKGFQKAKK